MQEPNCDPKIAAQARNYKEEQVVQKKQKALVAEGVFKNTTREYDFIMSQRRFEEIPPLGTHKPNFSKVDSTIRHPKFIKTRPKHFAHFSQAIGTNKVLPKVPNRQQPKV